MQFKVIREHIGDKAYAVGDVRDADEKTVAHLVPQVLEPISDIAEKSAASRSNKAESAAPANKASIRRKTKK